MTRWREMSIADLCLKTLSGGTPNRSRPELFSNNKSGIPWIKSQELINRRIDHALEHISELGLLRSSAKLIPSDAVLVAMYGATVGQLGYLTFEATTNQAVCALVADKTKMDPRFLFYALLNSRADLVSRAHGAAQQNLSQERIRQFKLWVPEVRIQHRISRVLGALDDLIENERRRVQLVEKMAEAIFREWFVNFRYPDHGESTMLDSPLGPIPEGWAIKALGEISNNFDRLRKPLSRTVRAQRSGPFPYFGAAKLIDWIDDWIFDGEYLLFAEDGTVQTSNGFPVLQLVDRRFWANNHTHILRGTEVSTQYLYLACARLPISGHITGVAQPKITQANLNRLPILVAPLSINRRFDKIVSTMFSHRNSLMNSVETLEAIRILLLPKLVTGQIDVSDLDIDALVNSVA